MIDVEYCGYTIKRAILLDIKDNEVQVLTAHDRDKASRIEDVLLGNGRRF